MNRLEALRKQLHDEVPLTRHMGLGVREYTGQSVVVTADFEANLNIHGTAFAGSLFSVCAVSGWALLHLKFEEAGIAALSVLGDAAIRYRRPVTHRIEACCRLPEVEVFDAFMARVGRGERAAVDLVTEILCDDRQAASFEGRYSARFE